MPRVKILKGRGQLQTGADLVDNSERRVTELHAAKQQRAEKLKKPK